ncbi:integrase_H2C2 domain-containing protein [Trichonephila clavipes]|nr:integrase_H2C2 domain-containing protein [Trichonephila clavipes]
MFKNQVGYTVVVDFSICRYIFFCDASKLAYSAVAFLRVDIGRNVHIQRVKSKTRIAPCGKKETTIARLELLGAAISARLSTAVLKEFPTDNVYFWTDFTTVLAWLKREEPRGVFVYNRVQEIRKLTPVKAWRHIPGSLNPADCPSRGCSAKQLCSLKWWEGPSWLHLSPQEWPISDVEVDVNEVEVNKERRAIVTSMMNVQTTHIKSDYFSTYSRNNRVVAWILHFIHNVSNATKLKGSLDYEEFKRAEVLVSKSLQSNAFQDERLLAKMQAFKDEDGLLRIRSKLADTKHVEVPFAPLTRDRVSQTKIFEVTGVDYAGPLYLKSQAKAWIVLFTCAVYRAEHFELVQSLTTDTFIQALRRFIARKGRISVIVTNNALRTLDWDKIVVYSTAQKYHLEIYSTHSSMVGVDGGSVLPLTYIHEDLNELLPLSPTMFIHGNSNCETPDLDQVGRSSLVKRIKYLQKVREDLRQRFRNEYLALLVHRGTRRNDALEVGDVVLIGHDNVRRIDWPLGIVLEVYPGKDRVPRVARIRTSHVERIHPFQRLYPLEDQLKLKLASGKDSLPVEKTPESPTNHASDSPTDYVPDSPVESTDNSEEKPPTKTRLRRAIKLPRKLDL